MDVTRRANVSGARFGELWIRILNAGVKGMRVLNENVESLFSGYVLQQQEHVRKFGEGNGLVSSISRDE